MNVTLKPFDFAQAVARAGLGSDGHPLLRGQCRTERRISRTCSRKRCTSVSQTQNQASQMQRAVQLGDKLGEPGRNHGRDAEGAARF